MNACKTFENKSVTKAKVKYGQILSISIFNSNIYFLMILIDKVKYLKGTNERTQKAFLLPEAATRGVL